MLGTSLKHVIWAEVGTRTVGERVDLRVLARVAIDAAEACEGVLPVDVHGAGAAYTLAAGAAESECRINFILDLDECVKNLQGRGR